MTFLQIYEDHKKLVYNLALNYVQNVEDAEEISQDVFISVYESLASFKSKSKVSTWIYRIAINKSLDFIKAKKAQKRFAFIQSIFGHDERPVNIPHTEHPGILLEHKEAIHHLMHCIDQLPEKQKTAIILSKIEQKSQAEMAEIMDLSEKAIESILYRAKQNLQKLLIKTKGN